MDCVLSFISAALLTIRKQNRKGIEERSKLVLVVFLFLPSLLTLFLLYSIGLSNQWFPFDKLVLFVISLLLFLLIRSIIFRRYRGAAFDTSVKNRNLLGTKNKKLIIFLFLFAWVFSIFLFWIGMVLIRNFILQY